MTRAATPTAAAPSDLTARLVSCGLFAEGQLPRPGGPPPPRIPSSHAAHRRFALHVLAGHPYEDACRLLGLNPRTAERWRTDLRRAAVDYFGRPVTYEFAARYALDPELRRRAVEEASALPVGSAPLSRPPPA